MAFITAETRSDIIALVVTMLNRAPDSALLDTLVTASTSGKSLAEVAEMIAVTAEFTEANSASQTAKEYATAALDRAFQGATVTADLRTAAIDLAVTYLNDGMSKAGLASVINDFLALPSTLANADFGNIAAAYANKNTVAEYYVLDADLGDQTVAELAAAIASVTDDAASVTTATASADATATAVAIVPGTNSALTAGLDTLTGSAGDDNFSATVQAAGGLGSTIAPGDVINGGAGIDTLRIAVAGALATNTPYTLSAVATNDVEKVLVSNFETTTAGTPEENNIFDGSLMTGVTTVGLSASSANGDTSFTNMKNIVDVEMMNGNADLSVAYVAGATIGTQTQNVAVSNLSNGTLLINGVENFNLSGGVVKSTIAAITGDKIKSLTITGDTDVKITGAIDFNNDLSGVAGALDGTIDASALTGKLTVTSASDEVSITGGTGNDTINMAGTLNGYDAINGGDGIDTLTATLTAFATTTFAQTSNIENIVINSAASAVGFDASRLPAGVTSLTVDLVDAAHATGAKLASTITKADGALINIVKTVEDQADANDSDGTTLTITDTTDSADDTVNIQLTNIGRDLHSATDYFGIDEIDVATYETVNITANTNALGTASLNEVEALTATVAKTINVTGSGALETVLTGTKVTTFDASGLAGKLTLTAGTEKATYSMGGKSSVITFAGNLNASDTVIGGAGTGDAITATVSGLSATTGALNLSGVEAAVLTTSGANTLALAGVTGLGSLTVTDNKQTITGLDLATTITLGLVGDESATGSEIDVTAADATGTDDTLKVNINAENGAPSSIIDASAIENLTVKVGTSTTATANTTTLDLTTFEGTSVSLSSGALAAGVVTTPGAIALGTVHKNTTTITSTNKGPVTANMSAATDPVTFTGKGTGIQDVTGGLRADTFNIGSTAGVAHVIVGNGGTDTTNLTAATNLADVSTIDTENVNVTVPASVDIAITGDFNAGVDNITLLGGNSLSTFNAGTIDAAVKVVDGSGFLGNVLVDFGADNFDSTVSVTGGELATDKVTAVLNTAATYVPVTAGVETLDIDSNGSVTLSLGATSGVSVVQVDLSTANKTVNVSGLSPTQTVALTGSANANNILKAIPVDATDADNVINFQVKDDATITAGTQLQTLDVETVNIKASTTEYLNLSGLTMTAAAKTVTLNLLADPLSVGVAVLTATSAQTTTINAAFSYGVVQTGRSATTAVDYTGSAGADTFIMMATGDNISGGAGKNDTIDVNYAAVLGGISVDLSATGEQISTLDGGAISGSVTGFENVDLAGYTGFGASVTAVKTGSTITGTPSTDRITGGVGNDTVRVVTATSADADVVTGGSGSDTIYVANGLAGTTTSQNIVDLTTPGNGAIANTGAFANYSGFENIDVSAEAGAGDGFSLKGDANANVIKGSAGDDIYTVTAGNDTVTLGAAVDNITVTTALLAANSGTTATIDGGTGVDVMTISDAGTTVVDADFRGISLVETLKLADGTNTVVTGATAFASGLVNLTGGTGVDTVTLHDSLVAYGITAGADVITFTALYDGGLTMTDAVTATNDQRIKFDAFQDATTSWGAAESGAAAVNAADKWFFGTGTLTIWNENAATPGAVTIALVGATVVADGTNAGSLTLDVA